MLERGQLEIVGGGWVQNEEATAHYADVINQVTEGHIWLQEHLGDAAMVKHGWQLDMFSGYSSVTPWLWSLAGFESSVIRFEGARAFRCLCLWLVFDCFMQATTNGVLIGSNASASRFVFCRCRALVLAWCRAFEFFWQGSPNLPASESTQFMHCIEWNYCDFMDGHNGAFMDFGDVRHLVLLFFSLFLSLVLFHFSIR